MKTRMIPGILFVSAMLWLMCAGCTAEATTPQGAAPTIESALTAPPALAPVDTDGWQMYEDKVHGFRMAYPPGWSYKPMEMSGPGMPDDWPVTATVIFYPDSMAEALNHEGPPDPNAPNVVPPFSIEVCVGGEAEFRRAYPEPRAAETIDVNGLTVVLERDTYDDFNTYRYVYRHPTDETIRVVLTDVVTGFSQRAQDNPEFVAWIPQIVAALQFADPSS